MRGEGLMVFEDCHLVGGSINQSMSNSLCGSSKTFGF
jgi:hypothetical protein